MLYWRKAALPGCEEERVWWAGRSRESELGAGWFLKSCSLKTGVGFLCCLPCPCFPAGNRQVQGKVRPFQVEFLRLCICIRGQQLGTDWGRALHAHRWDGAPGRSQSGPTQCLDLGNWQGIGAAHLCVCLLGHESVALLTCNPWPYFPGPLPLLFFSVWWTEYLLFQALPP